MGKRFYILVLLLTLAFTAKGQSIFSTIYNMDDGLSNNRVNAITQEIRTVSCGLELMTVYADSTV